MFEIHGYENKEAFKKNKSVILDSKLLKIDAQHKARLAHMAKEYPVVAVVGTEIKYKEVYGLQEATA